MGPGGSDMRALAVFLQSPDVNLPGITVVIGAGWRDEEVVHALRLLELLGRTDIRVYPGATHPLWRTREWTRLASQMYGGVVWKARGAPPVDRVRPLAEGDPSSKPADEDAAHFMIRMVHRWRRAADEYSPGD